MCRLPCGLSICPWSIDRPDLVLAGVGALERRVDQAYGRTGARASPGSRNGTAALIALVGVEMRYGAVFLALGGRRRTGAHDSAWRCHFRTSCHVGDPLAARGICARFDSKACDLRMPWCADETGGDGYPRAGGR